MNSRSLLFSVLLTGLTATTSVMAAPPTPPDANALRQAQERAEQAARLDGEKDGADYGSEYHYQRTYNDRYDREFRQIVDRLQHQAYDDGVRAGSLDGQTQGQIVGQRDGEQDGRTRGNNEGQQAGREAADAQALKDAQLPAQQDGQNRAAHSDASSSGLVKGTAEGDKAALEHARSQDYPKAASEYRASRFAQPTKSVKRMGFHPAGNREVPKQTKGGAGPSGGSLVAYKHFSERKTGPRFRPNAAPSFGTTQENDRYRSSYETTYNSWFLRGRDARSSEFINKGRQDALRQADRDAHMRDFSSNFTDGRNRGFQTAYNAAYGATRDFTFKQVYANEFQNARNASYQANYEPMRKAHFQRLSEEAYQQSYRQLFDQAQRKAFEETRAKKYPGYAVIEAKRGKADQIASFQHHPLRWLKVEPVVSGQALQRSAESTPEQELFEVAAGSEIALRLNARNFGATATPWVQILLEEGANSVYLPENSFAPDGPWIGECNMQTVDKSPVLQIRAGASDPLVRITVVLGGPNGESDRRTLAFRVAGVAPPQQ